MKREATKPAAPVRVQNSSTAISGLRISDKLLIALKLDFERRTKRDRTIPDKYNWSDHLRFLLQNGMDHSDY